MRATTTDTPQAELPKYRSHKVVHALKISGISLRTPDQGGGATIFPEDNAYAAFDVDDKWVARFTGAWNDDKGYYVVYEGGFASWSPTEAFENGTTPILGPGFEFGEAIRLLKKGCRVARLGWNGPGQYLEVQVPDEHSKMTLPYVYRTVQGDLVPWLASQTDVLQEDWCEVAMPGKAESSDNA